MLVTVVCVFIALSLSQVTSQATNQTTIVRQLTLTASTDHLVQGLTHNVSIQCAFNTDLTASHISFAEISRIRILKSEDNEHWKLIAEIRDNEVGLHLYDTVEGSGQIANSMLRTSYLNISWPTVTENTFGEYRCDVTGFDNNLNYAVESSNILILSEQNITMHDVLNLLLDEQNRLQHEMNAFMRLMDAKLNQSGQYSDQPWPEGSYSLLAPVTGCPRTSDWAKGFVKFHTESASTANADHFSDETFLPPYTKYSDGGQNFMILTYCSKIRSTPGILWPSGSYCISRRGSCPGGFYSGTVAVHVETTQGRSMDGGYHPDKTVDTQYFCCRSDGPASTDIQLPTADPFYLYRFNGTCQKVQNMRLHTESVTIDTEDSINNDHYYEIYHPDGSLNPFVLQLCYYDPY